MGWVMMLRWTALVGLFDAVLLPMVDVVVLGELVELYAWMTSTLLRYLLRSWVWIMRHLHFNLAIRPISCPRQLHRKVWFVYTFV